MIIRKSVEEIETMARAGAVVARAHEDVAAAVRAGVTTLELDAIAEDVIRSAGAVPSFKGYRGFPATLCTSVDHEVIHGIPDRAHVLADGMLLSVDCGAVVAGFHADAAVTHVVGDPGAVGARTRELVDRTREALWAGIRAAEPGNTIGDIGAAVGRVAADAGLGVLEGYVGHGVGRALHEDPSVPNQGVAGTGRSLAVGMVIAIEPMLTLGTPPNRLLGDGWTVVTGDGALSAHFEHTVAITADGPLVLTAAAHEPASL